MIFAICLADWRKVIIFGDLPPTPLFKGGLINEDLRLTLIDDRPLLKL